MKRVNNLLEVTWEYGMIHNVLSSYPGDNKKTRCFMCGHKSLNVTRKNGGLIKCWYCDLKGGTKALAKALVSTVTGYDLEPTAAMSYILQFMDGKELNLQEFKAPLGSEISNHSVNPELAHQFNSALIESLRDILPCNKKELNPFKGLLKGSYEDLKKRGFTDEDINEIGFIQAVESTSDGVLLAECISKKGVITTGMPGTLTNEDGKTSIKVLPLKNRCYHYGLTDHKGQWLVNNINAHDLVHYLIPVRDFNGRIRYFQVAWDKRISGETIDKGYTPKGKEPKVIDYPKYTAFSTKSDKDGASINAVAGWVGKYLTLKNTETNVSFKVPDLEGFDRIFVTEGTMKAPLFYSLSKRIYGSSEPGFSIAGVNNIKYLEQDLLLLKQIYPNLKYLDDCLDMDRFDNEHVMKATRELRDICYRVGIGYHMRVWNPEYKGCDDLMKHLLDYGEIDFHSEESRVKYENALSISKSFELEPRF